MRDVRLTLFPYTTLFRSSEERREGKECIRVGDIGEAGDELLRQVRKKLRRDHGFDHGAHRGISRMGVACVWSNERPVFPWADGTCGSAPEPGSNLRLDCATGLGSAVFVTATFGLMASGEVVRRLVETA